MIGVVIVTASVLFGARLLGAADDTVGVWSVRHEMTRGAPVGRADLVRREVRFADAGVAERYVSAEGEVPADVTLLRSLGPGELLPRAALGAAGDEQLVQVPLTVDSGAVPATVGVGSTVDVWVTPARDVASARPEPAVRVFREVTVLAVPAPESTLGPSSTRQVILGLDDGAQAGLGQALALLATGTPIMTSRG